MPVVTINSYSHINDEFYNMVTSPHTHAKLSGSDLVLFNYKSKITVELDDIFLHNRFLVEIKNRNFIEYKVQKAEDFKNFFNTFAGRYPYIIEGKKENLFQSIKLFYESMSRYNRNDNFMYCEENESGFVNLIFDDQFLKIDKNINPRILSLNNNKLSLFSLTSDDTLIVDYIKEIFNILEFKFLP